MRAASPSASSTSCSWTTRRDARNGSASGAAWRAKARAIEHVEGEIRVPWTKDVIISAPSYDDEDDRGLLRDDPDGIAISPEKERAAYQHYGVEPLTERPEGMSGPRFRAVLIEIRTTQRRP
jgi:hypothetical protein